MKMPLPEEWTVIEQELVLQLSGVTNSYWQYCHKPLSLAGELEWREPDEWRLVLVIPEIDELDIRKILNDIDYALQELRHIHIFNPVDLQLSDIKIVKE